MEGTQDQRTSGPLGDVVPQAQARLPKRDRLFPFIS